MSFAQPRTRSALVAIVAVGLEVALHVPLGDWPESQPVVATAAGVAIAVLAAVLGGVPAGLVAAAVGWALSFFLVADQSVEALIALPAWLAAAGLVGWLSDRARTAASQRDRTGRALAAVRDVAAEAVVPLDAEGSVAGWSPGATAMYGYTEEEIVGRPLADLFVDEEEHNGSSPQSRAARRSRRNRPCTAAGTASSLRSLSRLCRRATAGRRCSSRTT